MQFVVRARRAFITQRDQFPPVTLALLACAVIPMLQKLHVGLQVKVYSDNLICHAAHRKPLK